MIGCCKVETMAFVGSKDQVVAVILLEVCLTLLFDLKTAIKFP